MNTTDTFAPHKWIRDAYPNGVSAEHLEQIKGISRLLMRFESIGTGCRFGFVQRFYNCEPISLLRWAGVSVEDLANGLDSGWGDIADPANMRLEYRKDLGHFLFIVDRYRLIFHTEEADPQGDISALTDKLAKRTKFLVRKFFEDLRNYEKYLVLFIDQFDVPFEKIDVLCQKIFGYNQNNKILFVRKSRDEALVGTISEHSPNILFGYISERDERLDDGFFWPDWIKLCQKTDIHWQTSKQHDASTS